MSFPPFINVYASTRVAYNNVNSAFSLNQVTPVSAPVDVTVVVAPLVEPVIVSPLVNVPEGTTIVIVVDVGKALIVVVTPLVEPVIVVEDGRALIVVTTPLVPPVIVSATLKLPLAPTVKVNHSCVKLAGL